MAIYHYKESPLIDRIEVHSPRADIARATIIAKDGVSPEQLEKLREQLGVKKFSTLMDTVDGHAAIQVRGLKDAKSLFSALSGMGIAQSGITKEVTPDDHKKKESFKSRVRGKALYLSSIFYHIGNAAFFVSGIRRGQHNLDGKMASHDKSELMIGAAFALGDVMMTVYGKDRGDEELSVAAEGLKKHLHRKGIEIPKGDALTPDSLHQSGAMKATDRWMRKHIGHIKCLTELAGGLFTIHSATKPSNFNRDKLIAGLLISTAWTATFLLDKPRGHEVFDVEKPSPSTIAQTLVSNPRGWIARPLAMGNNIFNLIGANKERRAMKLEISNIQQAITQPGTNQTIANNMLLHNQRKQYDFIWNVFSACSFLVAHVLFGLSGGKRPQDTEDDKVVMNDLVLLSANTLARLPEEVRKANIGEMAEYVSKLAHVTLTKDKVAEAIQAKVTSLSQSTWAARLNTVPAGPQVTL